MPPLACRKEYILLSIPFHHCCPTFARCVLKAEFHTVACRQIDELAPDFSADKTLMLQQVVPQQISFLSTIKTNLRGEGKVSDFQQSDIFKQKAQKISIQLLRDPYYRFKYYRMHPVRIDGDQYAAAHYGFIQDPCLLPYG
jgi:hypothetical protein